MRVEIYRFFSDNNQTSGVCIVKDDNDFPLFTALTLERGSRDNKKSVSCVPSGKYTIKYEYSNKFECNLWELKDVPNRSECKFHSANFWNQLNGCISLGKTYKYIDNDSYRDLTDSKSTMKAFHEVLKDETELELIIY